MTRDKTVQYQSIFTVTLNLISVLKLYFTHYTSNKDSLPFFNHRGGGSIVVIFLVNPNSSQACAENKCIRFEKNPSFALSSVSY